LPTFIEPTTENALTLVKGNTESSRIDHVITSYSQNFEDVILWRALKDINQGRYVDVGAAHPVSDSVTRLFYDHGWSGLNLEPDKTLSVLLTEDRPRDVTVNVALGTEPSELTFWVSSPYGLSTLDANIARRHAEGSTQMTEVSVPVETLATIIDRHLPTGDIHFLKIDTEGTELDVIHGGDWVRHRPWIVVVETAGQYSADDLSVDDFPTADVLGYTDERITDAMIERGYLSAYADGLNQFFVSEEHSDLIPRIAIPPNVFDNFVRQREVAADERGALLERQAADAELRLAELAANLNQQLAETTESLDQERKSRIQANERLDTAFARETELNATLQSVVESRSWRITAPLRSAFSLRRRHSSR